MATMEKANKAAEQLTRTTGDSYKTVIDHTVALQERNVRFAQGIVDGTIEELRQQVESNRAVAGELVERAERQRDAFQTLVEESVEVFPELFNAPFAYFRQGMKLVESGVSAGGFPIAGYDELNVNEISEQLDALSLEQLKTVREYEKRNKNRDTLIEQIDRKIKAATA